MQCPQRGQHESTVSSLHGDKPTPLLPGAGGLQATALHLNALPWRVCRLHAAADEGSQSLKPTSSVPLNAKMLQLLRRIKQQSVEGTQQQESPAERGVEQGAMLRSAIPEEQMRSMRLQLGLPAECPAAAKATPVAAARRCGSWTCDLLARMDRCMRHSRNWVCTRPGIVALQQSATAGSQLQHAGHSASGLGLV
jgi:hypothetical protein